MLLCTMLNSRNIIYLTSYFIQVLRKLENTLTVYVISNAILIMFVYLYYPSIYVHSGNFETWLMRKPFNKTVSSTFRSETRISE